MPNMIRLRRVGRNKQANFRVVVVDKQAPRDGAYIESIGFYNPRSEPAELRLVLEKLDGWVAKGAQMTDTVASLARKARKGGDRVVEIVPLSGRPPKPAAPVETPPAKPARGAAAKAAKTEAPPADDAAAPVADEAPAPADEAPAATDGEAGETPES